MITNLYLLDININELKTYEGDHELLEKSEYYKFNIPVSNIIKEFDRPIEEISWCYVKGFKEKLLTKFYP